MILERLLERWMRGGSDDAPADATLRYNGRYRATVVFFATLLGWLYSMLWTHPDEFHDPARPWLLTALRVVFTIGIIPFTIELLDTFRASVTVTGNGLTLRRAIRTKFLAWDDVHVTFDDARRKRLTFIDARGRSHHVSHHLHGVAFLRRRAEEMLRES